jgi:PKD repeat protein
MKCKSILQSPLHTYSKTGTYHATLVVNTLRGCRDTFRSDVVVVHPVAAFGSVPSKCEGNNSSFADSSIVPKGDSIISKTWDFGDGSPIVSMTDPKHIYKKPGLYKATLKISTRYGCFDSITKSIRINAGPKAAFGFNGTCLKDSTLFTNTSVVAAGTPVYSWDFGDKSTSVLTNPLHLFKNADVSYVKLIVTTFTGCSDTFGKKVTVTDVPHPKISGDSVVCFGNAGHIKITPVAGHTYAWVSHPSGFSSTSSNPVVTPKVSTVYIVSETNDSSGCKGSDSAKVVVNPLPNVKWYEHDSVHVNNFTAIEHKYSKPSYKWDFGDGAKDTISGYAASHAYQKNKIYTVKLKVTDAKGCVNELDSDVTVTVLAIEGTMEDPWTITIFPNPFSANTNVQYHLAKSSQVNITICDITGRQLGIITREKQIAGDYKTDFNAETYGLRPGTYVLKFEMDGQISTKQLIKL